MLRWLKDYYSEYQQGARALLFKRNRNVLFYVINEGEQREKKTKNSYRTSFTY